MANVFLVAVGTLVAAAAALQVYFTMPGILGRTTYVTTVYVTFLLWVHIVYIVHCTR